MKYIFFAILVSLLPILVSAQADTQYKKDSLRNAIGQTDGEEKLKAYMRLTGIYFNESKDDLKMDTLLTLYREFDKEADKQGSIKYKGLVRGNILSAYSNRKMYDEIIRFAPGYLDELAKPEGWKFYYYCYTKLIDAHIYKGDSQTAIREAEHLYAQAEKLKSDEGMALALYAMSKIFNNQSRQEEREKCYRQALQLLEGNESLLSLSANIYFDLCQTLLSQKRYDETLITAREFEKINEQYEAFAKASVPTSWGNLWGVYARLYVETGEYDKAEVYCNKVDSVIDGPRYKMIVYSVRARILNARGEYEEALKTIDETLDSNEFYTSEINGRRGIKMDILKNMGRYREAYELSKEAAFVSDSIRKIELARQIDELRTVYEVDEHIAEKKQMRNYMLFAFGGCLLLAILLGIWIYYNRRIQKKNRGLVRQIKEQDWLEEELKREREKNRKLQSQIDPDNAISIGYDKESEIFDRLSQLMKEKQLYTKNNITRKDLACQLGVNDRFLHDCIKNNVGMNFSEYINSLRLAHSRELLAQATDKWTVEAIALDSGFSSRPTFYRNFREKYGLSPDEYRKLSKELE